MRRYARGESCRGLSCDGVMMGELVLLGKDEKSPPQGGLLTSSDIRNRYLSLMYR